MAFCQLKLIVFSSIRSVASTASKQQSLASLSSASKNKSTDEVNYRAIPGPGDDIEAEPEPGVVETEKVSVVFLVSVLVL